MAKRRKPSSSPKSKASRPSGRSAVRPVAPRRPRGKAPRSAHSPLKRAQALARKAFESSDIERCITLAQRALALSRDCADAYTALSRFVSDPRQALELLEQGLAAAERILAPNTIAEARGDLWSVHEAHPYMRARLELAECLWALGCSDEAVGHLQELLRLNHADHQGARYLLSAHLLELGRDSDFDRLIDQYPERGTLLLFSRALREFRRRGDSDVARETLAQARSVNRHVVKTLLRSTGRSRELPDTCSPGQADEAMHYVADFGGGWKRTPGAITWLRQTVTAASRRTRKPPVGPTEAVKKQLERLPQSYGTIWQAAVSRVPTWLRDGGLTVRPWSILIVNHSEHLIIGQELVAEEPTPELVFDHLVRAMRNPLAGRSRRPSEIQVREEPLWRAVQPHLEEVGVDCIYRAELEEADYILGEMHKLMRPKGQPPGISECPTFASAQGASLYDAAAGYFRRAPWRKLPHNATIQIDCPQLREFGSGQWFAVVLGQAGQTLGVALYNDLGAVDAICGGGSPGNGIGDATSLSLLFGESFEVPICDLVAAEQHRWPLAGPEAYPLVLCTSGGTDVRELEPWELQLLEACVRTIPDFVQQNPFIHGPATATFTPVAPANLKLTLSWIEPEERGCGEECGECQHSP
jgi:hypothetical protein